MHALDTRLFLWLNASDPTPAWLMGLAHGFSQVLPLLAGLALLPLLCLGPSARRQVGVTLTAMVLAWLSVRAIRWGFEAPRPFELGLGHQWLAHAAGSGFPSTHATVAAAWAAGLSLAAPRAVRTWALVTGLMALGIAWSRVFLGVHFPSDVVVGLALGVFCAAIARLMWHGRFARPLTAASGSQGP